MYGYGKTLARRQAKFRKKQLKAPRIFYTKETYQAYLKSPHWKKIQKRYYSIFKSCQLCLATDARLNIHHLTYQRLGWERNTDLIVLCEDCHINKVHAGTIPKGDLKAIVKKAWGHLPKTGRADGSFVVAVVQKDEEVIKPIKTPHYKSSPKRGAPHWLDSSTYIPKWKIKALDKQQRKGKIKKSTILRYMGKRGFNSIASADLL